MKGLATLFLLAGLTFPLVGCGPEPGTPEEQVHALIEAGEQAAEEKDLPDLADLVSENYMDRRGNDKTMLLRMVRGYFLRGQRIELITDVDTVEFPTERRASVVMSVAMAAASGDSFLPTSADLIWFTLEFEDEDEGDWLLIRADWGRERP